MRRRAWRRGPCRGGSRHGRLRDAAGHDRPAALGNRGRRGCRLGSLAAAARAAPGRGGSQELRAGTAACGNPRRGRHTPGRNGTRRLAGRAPGQQADRPRTHLRPPAGGPRLRAAAVRCAGDRAVARGSRPFPSNDHQAGADAGRRGCAGKPARRRSRDPPARRRCAGARRARRVGAAAARIHVQDHHPLRRPGTRDRDALDYLSDSHVRDALGGQAAKRLRRSLRRVTHPGLHELV